MSCVTDSASQSKRRAAGAEAGAVHRARINKKFTVEITATRLGIFCEWIPEVPRAQPNEVMVLSPEGADALIG